MYNRIMELPDVKKCAAIRLQGGEGVMLRKPLTLLTPLMVFMVTVVLIFTAYGSDRQGAAEAFEHDSFAMGTVISQKVYGANGQAAAGEAAHEIERLDQLLTFNDSRGDVYRLNNNAGIKAIQVDPITTRIINKANQVSAMSGGAFDITVGPLVKAWGIGSDREHIPSPDELDKLLPLIDYRDIEINDNVARIKNQGQMVDLGGIAKGFAGDAVIEIYKRHGIQSAFINLGGNVVTLGGKPDGTPWKVGIRDPRPEGMDKGRDIGVVNVISKAVVTAGDDQRYFIASGRRYHHILDPFTGYPAKSDLMSVTLITDSSLDADALDTAVYILGLEKGRDLIRQFGGVEAVFITVDKKVYVTEGLKDSFDFHGESSGYVYQP